MGKNHLTAQPESMWESMPTGHPLSEGFDLPVRQVGRKRTQRAIVVERIWLCARNGDRMTGRHVRVLAERNRCGAPDQSRRYRTMLRMRITDGFLSAPDSPCNVDHPIDTAHPTLKIFIENRGYFVNRVHGGLTNNLHVGDVRYT